MLSSISDVFTNSVKTVGEKVSSSAEEERLEQATTRILLKAACIKKIMSALDCSWEDACKILEQELEKSE